MLTYSIFSTIVEPGKRTRVLPVGDFRLTTATFGEELKDTNGRTTIKFYQMVIPEGDSDEEEEEESGSDSEKAGKELEFEKKPIVIAHLTAGRIETQLLDLIFLEDEPVEFEVTGKNTVHLVGNYIDQRPMDMPDGFDTDSDDEDGHVLEDVSSDVEVNPSDVMGLDIDSDDIADSGKIVEVTEQATVTTKKEKKEKKDKKRARESDAAADAPEAEEKESEKEKKKNKKQKAEDGTAVATGTDATTKSKGAPDYDKKGKFPLPSGVVVDVHTIGAGPPARKGQTLSIRYIGKVKKDMSIFGKNTSGKPFSFKLGAGDVIKGWDEGIVGLKAGAEAIITIPPAMAYANKKVQGIPAGSTIHLEVKILSIT